MQSRGGEGSVYAVGVGWEGSVVPFRVFDPIFSSVCDRQARKSLRLNCLLFAIVEIAFCLVLVNVLVHVQPFGVVVSCSFAVCS